MNLTEILKDSNYNLSLFSEKEIKELEAKIKIEKTKALFTILASWIPA